MTVPIKLSSTPSNGAENVPTNLELTVTFNTPLDEDTIQEATQLINMDTNDIYPISVGLSENTITYYPGRALEDYTRFELRIIGSDISSGLQPLKSEDGDALTATIIIRFLTSLPITTGSSSTTTEYTTTEVDASGQTIAAAYDIFAFSESNPPDSTLFVGPTYYGSGNTSITIDYNLDIDPVSSSGAITIEQRAFVDRRYAADTSAEIEGLSDYYLDPQDNVYCPAAKDTFTSPGFSISVEEGRIVISMDDANAFKWNSQVNVTVDKSLASSSDTGSQTLASDTEIIFTTAMFPWYGEIEEVRLELGPANEHFTDFLITRFLLRASIRAWKLACFKFELCRPPFFVVEYAVLRAIYDIMTGPEGRAVFTREKSKTLGSFSVKYSAGSSSDTDEMYKKLKAYEFSLRNMCRGYTEATTGVKGTATGTYPALSYRERHWHSDGGKENTKNYRVYKNPKINETYVNISDSTDLDVIPLNEIYT